VFFNLLRVFGSFWLKKNEGFWCFENFLFFYESSEFFIFNFPASIHLSSWGIYRESDLLIKSGKLGQVWCKKRAIWNICKNEIFFVMPLVMGDEVYKNDELLYVRMVPDAQIVVKESNGSEMCIWSEFVKVDVFFFGFYLNFVLLKT